MTRFTRALARKPCRNLVHGLTSVRQPDPPDPGRALEQHAAYVEALRSCGLEVTVLEADEEYPDSVFIEDTAVLSGKAAVLCRPGAHSRRGEEKSVALALKAFFPGLEAILSPGTLDGGDVLGVGDRFYVGLSARSNREGARQLGEILGRHGQEVVSVPLARVLHLKTGVSFLGDNRLLAGGEFLQQRIFSQFSILAVPAGEEYAANSLRVNDRVLVPAGFPRTRRAIENAGLQAQEVDVSEFRKLDGGLSCLSLRF